ncbi:hypothetical protein M432DRAFT_636821 [Thermoascus aurantiacus ATCC 26904]
MPHRFESDERVTLSNDESDASADLPDIFSNNPSEDTSESDTEPDSDDLDGDSEDNSDNDSDDDALFNNEEQHPPDPKTQKKLEETRDYWDRFCRFQSCDPVECFHALSEPEETVR